MKKHYLLLPLCLTMGFAGGVEKTPKKDLFQNWWLKSAFKHPKSEKILSHFQLQRTINQSWVISKKGLNNVIK